MRNLEEQNERIAEFLVTGDASRFSTPAAARRRPGGACRAPSEVGYDSAARRLELAMQGGRRGGSVFGARSSVFGRRVRISPRRPSSTCACADPLF